jgi:hypothetical protein
MVRKRIRKILSGGAVVFIVLLSTLDVGHAQFGGAKVTYTIQGSTGVPGVTMSGFPSQDGKTVVTDQNGFYSAVVDFGWSGTVKPAKEGWEFEPDSRIYQRVTSNMDNENYTPSEITYTISGRVTGPDGPMSGVQMSGLPGGPITGTDGTYSATVPYGWSETFKPVKEGYTFSPPDKGFGPIRSDQVQNFSASAIQLLITGTVGVPGVKMNGLPGNVVSGANGVFSTKVDYNWTGTITPEKEGYVFEPAEQQYVDIITDQTNQNFNAKMLTYTVSGSAGMAGVEMKGLPGNPYTDQNGFFSVQVEHGFSNTVTPTKEGYEFDPATYILADVKSDRTNITFVPEMIKVTISGSIAGLEGVQMIGLPDNPLTDKDGKYSVTVEWGWSGTVTPFKEGYKFTPESKPYPPVTEDMTNQNYTYSKVTYTITGNAQISGVTMKGFPGRAVVTDASGSYTATVEHGWSGTVTPVKEGYEFEPSSIQFTDVQGPQSGQDFMGSLLQRKISGMVRTSKGQPVEGVNVVANNNGGQATTDSTGKFEIVVGYGWSGTITPFKEGYTFSPPAKTISRITVDQMNQTFIAKPEMFTVTGEVKINGVPIEGVLITASDGSGAPITATTDRQGKYAFQVPYGWTGEITPTKEGINFTPPSVPLIDVKTNIVNGQPVAPSEPPETATPRVEPGPTTPDTTAVRPGPGPTVEPPGIVVPGGPGPEVTTPGPNVPDAVRPTSPEDEKMTELQKQIDDLKAALAGRGTVAGPNAPGAVDATGMPLITNAWFDNELALDVLPAISEQAGIPIIADEGVGGLIRLTLKNEPLERALELVLAGTPYTYKKRNGYYLVAQAGITNDKFPIFSETRRVRLNYVTAQAAVDLLSTAFKPYVQAETATPEPRLAPGATTYTSELPKTYTVLVTAPPALMERIVEDLRMIDQMPSQVLLKARIVAMSRTDLLNLGIEWGWPTMQLGIFGNDLYGGGDVGDDFGGEIPWGIQMGYTPDLTFTNALQLALNLLTVNGEATIRAEPQVLALDGEQATMRVVNEEYFFLTADFGDNAQQFYLNSQLEIIESGTTLTITPHIVEGDRIVLKISVEVSDSIPAGRENDLPIVTRRTADNTVTVQNGGTVALAGLSQEKSATTHKRTPGLSNIPLLGNLFNNQDDQTTSREVAVFVTAHILPNNQYDSAASSIPRAAPPAPTGSPVYSLPPMELERASPRVEPRPYRPMDRSLNETTVDPRYNPPADSIRSARPVYPQYNPPAPNSVPRMRLPGSFKDELGQELNRNR